MQGLLGHEPSQFQAVYKRYAAQGARVLALAARRLPADLPPSGLRHLPREQAESGLSFVGEWVVWLGGWVGRHGPPAHLCGQVRGWVD